MVCRMLKNLVGRTLMLAPLAAFAGGTAYSQEQGSSQASAESTALEEIVVTARRREEQLSDVPIAITAVGGEDLRLRNIADTVDLKRVVPNFNIDPGSSTTLTYKASIRGVSEQDFILTTEPAVAIYVDGVYIARMNGGVMDLLDVERVEVLRGPQGTLFGKNTTGGAVNIVTEKPGEIFAAEAELSFGNLGRRNGRGSINVPISERAAARFSIASNRRDGYFDNHYDGSKMSDTDSLGARGSLLWAPTDASEIILTADHVKVRQESMAGQCVLLGGPEPTLRRLMNQFANFNEECQKTTAGDVHEGFIDLPGKADLDSTRLTATVTADWAGKTWKSITSWQDMETIEFQDLDSSGLAYLHNLVGPLDHEQFSQEFQTLGMLWDGRVNFVGGLFYFYEKGEQDSASIVAQPLFPILGDISSQQYTEAKTESYAAYGELSFSVAEAVSMSMGLRYTFEDKRLERFSQRSTTGIALFDLSASDEFGAWTPRFSIQYAPRDNLMTYASWSRGFKSGGFNGRASRAEQMESYQEETLSAWEVGIKSSFLDNRVVLNAAAFYSDYEDIQRSVNQLDPQTLALVAVIKNAAEATIKGAEIELLASPADRLQLSLSAGYTDGEYDEFIDQSPSGEIDRSDLDLNNAPKYTVSAGVQYQFLLGDFGSLVARLDYYRRAEVYHDVFNTQEIKQGAYGLWDGRLAFTNSSERLSVEVWGKNLGDEEYLVGGIGTPGSLGFGGLWWAPPRTYGIDLRWQM